MECKHFGLCGGCQCEAVPSQAPRPAPYAQELLQKEKRVRELLRAFEVEEWRPTIPSPEEWHYRNKMEFAFAAPYSPAPDLRTPSPLSRERVSNTPSPYFREKGQGDEGGLVLGLRQAGSYSQVVDLETCGLISEQSLEVLKRVRRWALEHGLRGYHRRRHEGDLRYLVIREGINTGERMAVLLATSAGAKRCEADHLANLRPLLSSLWLGVTDSKSDVARADDMRLLWGPGAITEKLIARTYQISPYSFFQTNTHGTEKLYELLQEWARSLMSSPAAVSGGRHTTGVRPQCVGSMMMDPRQNLRHTSGGERLLSGAHSGTTASGALIDLYCGSGGIALALADHFERVVGIDTNADAIEDAKKNAQANDLQNTEFVCEDAHQFLKKLPGSKLSVQLSAMVVDPPRAGLHPKASSALLELNPASLAYVSCNPESLARDLQPLVPFYRIRRANVVDLFPHTPHVETVVFMEHR